MIPPGFKSYSGVHAGNGGTGARSQTGEAPRVGPPLAARKPYGFGGVVNQSQVFVSKLMSAKQLSSSCSCTGPPVPTLEAQSSGRKPGSDTPGCGLVGGVLVKLARFPLTPVFASGPVLIQQLPVFPAY